MKTLKNNRIEPNEKPTSNLISQLITILLFVVVCFSWGTTWIGIKIAVETVPPLTSAGIRFLITFPLFIVFAYIKKEPLFFPKENLAFFWGIVIFYFVLPYFLINYGEQYVSSGLSALLFSTMPVLTMILSVFFLNDKIVITQVVGIAIGFLSLLFILISQGMELGYQGFLGVVAVFLAAIMHAVCYIITKKQGDAVSVITINVLPIGIAGFLLFTTGWFVEQPSFDQISTESIIALLYLGILASVGGFITYFYLLKQLNPVVLSFVFIIFPVISVVIGSYFDEKIISPYFAILFSLLLFGFALTKIPPKQLVQLKEYFKKRIENVLI